MDRAGLNELFDVKGRVAIVTGGTRGIGRAVAEGLALGGARVVVASRKAEPCRETQAHLESLGAEALGVPTHLGDMDAVGQLVEQTATRFGAIDIIVNNAATALALPMGQFTSDAWNKVFDVNLRGPVFLVQDALPYLKESAHPAVLNVISVGAFMFAAAEAMYAAAKAALLSFTRTMAAAYAPFGIRVNALAPGTTDTDMVRNNGPEYVERASQISLLRRMASADEMVGPALFLVSDAASYVTGQVLIADGGLVAH